MTAPGRHHNQLESARDLIFKTPQGIGRTLNKMSHVSICKYKDLACIQSIVILKPRTKVHHVDLFITNIGTYVFHSLIK